MKEHTFKKQKVHVDELPVSVSRTIYKHTNEVKNTWQTHHLEIARMRSKGERIPEPPEDLEDIAMMAFVESCKVLLKHYKVEGFQEEDGISDRVSAKEIIGLLKKQVEVSGGDDILLDPLKYLLVEVAIKSTFNVEEGVDKFALDFMQKVMEEVAKQTVLEQARQVE